MQQPITRRSKKQFVVARSSIKALIKKKKSSVKAKFRSLVQGICEFTWLQRLMNELKLQSENPMLYCDNKSTISIVGNLTQHDRTKNVEVD